MLRCALFLFAVVWPSVSSAYDMTRRDRLAMLYSNQVVFDRRGEPLVSVRITEEQDLIRFTSSGRITLMPGGDDGSLIRSPRQTDWTIRVDVSAPGEIRWWVAAERIPAHNLAVVSRKRRYWQDQGFKVKLFEAGALIGIGGQTLDTRTLTIGLSPKKTRSAAQKHAEELGDKIGLRREVIADPIRRPSGWIIARESRTGIEIKSKDLLWISQSDRGQLEFPAMEYGHGTPRQRRANRRYAGDIYFAIGHDGKLAAVNVLSAERLLEGVVPSELYPGAPTEALKAQAVAARGQLLAKIGTRHRSDPYLLCAETHCQVYTGATKRSRRSTAAVQATRGQLLFEGKRLVDTTYSSACGGHSEAAHLMWGGEPRESTQGRYDRADGQTTPIGSEQVEAFIDSSPKAFCARTGKAAGVFRWQVKRTGPYVTKRVNAVAPIGPVIGIKPLKRGRSGRAMAVEYIGLQGRKTIEGAYRNRKLLGNLRSGLFVVKRIGGTSGGPPKEWAFKGGGFGHGVGMCQHGAMGMAAQGYTFDKILFHYYLKSHLKKAW